MAIEDDILALCNTIDGKVDALAIAVAAISTGAALDEDISAHTTAGTLGDLVGRVNSQFGLGTP
ncbi:MAG: hypothetical protein WC208_14910 [Gallionella sp.]|jgi:hypothetical protein